MGYYMAGDYLQAGGLGSLIRRGVRAVARSPLAGRVLRAVPFVGTAAAAVDVVRGVRAAARGAEQAPPSMIATGSMRVAQALGAGPSRIGGRRMNAGNAKAARRAIRRIKAARKLLRSIESELPRQRCACGGRARRAPRC